MIYESTLIHAHNDFQKDYWSYCVVIFAIFYSNFNLFSSYRRYRFKLHSYYVLELTERNELEVNFQNLILYVIFADDGNYIAVCHVA